MGCKRRAGWVPAFLRAGLFFRWVVEGAGGGVGFVREVRGDGLGDGAGGGPLGAAEEGGDEADAGEGGEVVA